MTACNHTWQQSPGRLETCAACGKVRYREPLENDMNEPKVIKKVDRENLPIVRDKNHDTMDSSELVRRFREFRRAYLALEKAMSTQGLDLKSE